MPDQKTINISRIWPVLYNLLYRSSLSKYTVCVFDTSFNTHILSCAFLPSPRSPTAHRRFAYPHLFTYITLKGIRSGSSVKAVGRCCAGWVRNPVGLKRRHRGPGPSFMSSFQEGILEDPTSSPMGDWEYVHRQGRACFQHVTGRRKGIINSARINSSCQFLIGTCLVRGLSGGLRISQA